MSIPRTYLLTRSGRVHYFIWSAALGGSGVFLLSAYFAEGTKAYEQGVVLHIFAGLVVALWFGYASYCGLRAVKSAPRFIVDESGFLYQGLFKTLRFEWKDIIAFRKIVPPRYSDRWLEVTASENEQVLHIKLDFSGVHPGMDDFVRQARSLAPWIAEYRS